MACGIVMRFLLAASKQQKKAVRLILRDWFIVHKDRIARVMKELERKAFHVAGFIIPATYIALLESGTLTRRQCAMLLGTLASIQLAIELGRKVCVMSVSYVCMSVVVSQSLSVSAQLIWWWRRGVYGHVVVVVVVYRSVLLSPVA